MVWMCDLPLRGVGECYGPLMGGALLPNGYDAQRDVPPRLVATDNARPLPSLRLPCRCDAYEAMILCHSSALSRSGSA